VGNNNNTFRSPLTKLENFPLFFTGRKLRLAGIGIEVPKHSETQLPPHEQTLHCVSKIDSNFETVQLEIIWIDFNDIWQK